eukprot:3207777-Pyramimonas_sp.AAC.1
MLGVPRRLCPRLDCTIPLQRTNPVITPTTSTTWKEHGRNVANSIVYIGNIPRLSQSAKERVGPACMRAWMGGVE